MRETKTKACCVNPYSGNRLQVKLLIHRVYQA